MNLTLLQKKKVILIDFFDTVMFRKIHSYQIMPQWKKGMIRKYPQLRDMNEDLILLRKHAIEALGGNESTINYYNLIKHIWYSIADCYRKNIVFEEFYSTSLNLDMYIDMATQYPNKRIVKFLKKAKQDGKKIFLVTDYYLPKEVYNHYLEFFDLCDLFDGLFVSSDCGKTKYDGDLYSHVLKTMNIDVEDAVMIGDSKHSDYENAKKVGLHAYWYIPVLHKIYTNIVRKFNFEFRPDKHLFKKSYKYTSFGEYALELFYFVRNLDMAAREKDICELCFLARGGYLLKILFEDYQDMCIEERQKIVTSYIYNSRKANHAASEDEEIRKMLKNYLELHIHDNKLAIVDEGWYGTSQKIFAEICDCNVYGFYLGVMGRNGECSNSLMKGVLFDIDNAGKKSYQYGIFRTNCTFYEQICAGGHGSTVGYMERNSVIAPILEVNKTEQRLYERYTQSIQTIIRDNVKCLIAWQSELTKKQLAKWLLKTLMFANHKRLQCLEKYNLGFIDNSNNKFVNRLNQKQNIEIDWIELIMKPENYMRYFCKLKEKFSQNKFLRIVYYPLGVIIYLYCWLRISLSIERE